MAIQSRSYILIGNSPFMNGLIVLIMMLFLVTGVSTPPVDVKAAESHLMKFHQMHEQRHEDRREDRPFGLRSAPSDAAITVSLTDAPSVTATGRVREQALMRAPICATGRAADVSRRLVAGHCGLYR